MADRFKLLSQEIRLHIIAALYQNRMSVAQISETIQSSQPNVSKHLKILHEGGILSREQHGTQVHYSLADLEIFKVCGRTYQQAKNQLREKMKQLG